MMKKYGVVGLVLVAVVVCVVVMQSKDEDRDQTTEYSKDTEGVGSAPMAVDRVEPIPPDNQSSESEKSVEDPRPFGVDHLSAPVQALLLEDGREHNYATLLAEIGKLGKDLPASDTAALMEMLAWPNDRFPEKMRPIEINAVKNDVLDNLLRQTTLPEGLGPHMVAMAQNAERDPVWRDYCIQFMDPLYQRLTTEYAEITEVEKSNPSVKSVDERGVVREAMYAALDEREHTLAGTALIGLENLSRTHEEFDKQLIAEKAVAIASDEMVSMESRLTALRLASGLTTEDTENTEVVEAARGLAQTGETVYMRSAAIVTLGEIGSDEDRELLESFVMDQDRQIAAAAKMALTKMDQRTL